MALSVVPPLTLLSIIIISPRFDVSRNFSTAEKTKVSEFISPFGTGVGTQIIPILGSFDLIGCSDREKFPFSKICGRAS